MPTLLSATDKSTCETVLSIDWWTDSLFCLTITRPPAYRFIPGQFSRLGLAEVPSGAPVVWRAYSVTSHSDAETLEYYGITVPGGAFTGAVAQLQPGDPILLDKQPNGFMTIDRFTGGESLWMLATGTGLGPFIAILRERTVWTRFRDLIVVHCVRHATELAYRSALEALGDAAANDPLAARLHLIQSVTREADGPGWLHGRVTTLLDDGTLESAAGVPLVPESARIMLCGNPAMIDDTRRRLQQRGFLPCRRANSGHFLTENYW